MQISRRVLLGASALLPLGLAACVGQDAATIGQQVVTDVRLIANGLAAELPAISTLTGVDAATLADINAKVAEALAAAQQVVAGMAQSAAQPLVQQIGSDVAAVLAALGGVTSIPTNVQQIIAAVEALLPVVMAAVGLFAARKATRMTPAQARVVLAGVR